MFRTFEKGFLAQWVLLAVGLVLLGGAVAHNLYKIHRDIMVGERHRLQTQARVVSDNLTVQIAAADRIITALRSELSGRDPAAWQRVIAEKQMKLFQDVLPGIRVLNAIDADGRIRLSNRDELVGRSMAQRDYFIHARDARNKDILFDSSPFRTLLGAW
ncbi:MAG: hypothetical protein WCR32_08540, partial [Geobacter sp.]